MRSTVADVLRAFGCQCNSPGFDPSIFRHSGIWGAADEAVLNKVHRKPVRIYSHALKNKNTGDDLSVWLLDARGIKAGFLPPPGGGGGVGPDGSIRGDERAGSRQTTLSVSGPPSFSSGEKLGVNIVRSVQLPPPLLLPTRFPSICSYPYSPGKEMHKLISCNCSLVAGVSSLLFLYELP
jgi:hypothetical protein